MKIGVSVNGEGKFGATPLFNACLKGNASIVKCLVEFGADVNKINNSNGENTTR